MKYGRELKWKKSTEIAKVGYISQISKWSYRFENRPIFSCIYYPHQIILSLWCLFLSCSLVWIIRSYLRQYLLTFLNCLDVISNVFEIRGQLFKLSLWDDSNKSLETSNHNFLFCMKLYILEYNSYGGSFFTSIFEWSPLIHDAINIAYF